MVYSDYIFIQFDNRRIIYYGKEIFTFQEMKF